MRVTGFGYGGASGGSAAARAAEAAIGTDVNNIRTDLRRRSGPSIDAVARLLGVSTGALQADLRGGATLAAIAKGHGKSAADVDGALLGGVQTKLTAAVTAGSLSQPQADSILRSVRGNVDRLVAGDASTTKPIARGTTANLLDALSGDARAGVRGPAGQAGSPGLVDVLASRSSTGRTTVSRSTAASLADFLA